MKSNKLTVASLLSILLFISASAFTSGYAAQNNPRATKAPTPAPTGADCQAIATAAAEKVKANGGTAAEQQAAYSQAKMKCKEKM